RPEAGRNILIELDLHRSAGIARSGKSSAVDAAAKAMTAQTLASPSEGKSSRISAIVAPSARLARTVRTGTRVQRITGSPPQILGSWTMCCEYSIMLFHLLGKALNAPFGTLADLSHRFRFPFLQY